MCTPPMSSDDHTAELLTGVGFAVAAFAVCEEGSGVLTGATPDHPRRAREIDAANGGTGDLIAFDDSANRIIFEFDMRLADDSKNWIDRQKTFSLWQRLPLNVHLTPVSR